MPYHIGDFSRTPQLRLQKLKVISKPTGHSLEVFPHPLKLLEHPITGILSLLYVFPQTPVSGTTVHYVAVLVGGVETVSVPRF